MQQIRDRNYEEVLIDDGMKTTRRYAVACHEKCCKGIAVSAKTDRGEQV
ncbi:MAG: hypothetical protein HFJ08_14005 [Lachnospiraceae bacterium]|nr:hypothetical protein [Lachnospiraceae bacterium]MCI9401173.1 hypothetical protein [Lachnospiraceae bacterium]MCX4376399.1 hypothetical protein [Lachnospiraceae bacterium]